MIIKDIGIDLTWKMFLSAKDWKHVDKVQHKGVDTSLQWNNMQPSKMMYINWQERYSYCIVKEKKKDNYKINI